MYPNNQNLEKESKLMMNLSLLSSLNQKINLQTYQNIIPNFPQTIPYQQNQNLTQLGFQSLLNENNNNMFYYNNQICPIKNNDSFYFNNIYYNKPYTTLSYYVNQDFNPNEFLNKKTSRNKIIINEEGKSYNNIMNNNKIHNDKIYNNNFLNNIKILNKDFYNINNNINNNNNYCKYNTTLIFKMNDYNNIMFETHFLKTDINKEKEKKYKCKHPKCELCYKTKKQLVSHHGKMDIECQRDTVCILKLISNAKKLILNLNNNNKLSNQSFNHVIEKYENLIKNVSITDYAQMICGNKFKDIIISTQEIQNFNFNNFKEQIQKLNFNNIN